MSTIATTWTDERVALLRKLWRDFSASQIGRKLGVSRNAVIGKVHRLRLRKQPGLPKQPATEGRAR